MLEDGFALGDMTSVSATAVADVADAISCVSVSVGVFSSFFEWEKIEDAKLFESFCQRVAVAREAYERFLKATAKEHMDARLSAFFKADGLDTVVDTMSLLLEPQALDKNVAAKLKAFAQKDPDVFSVLLPDIRSRLGDEARRVVVSVQAVVAINAVETEVYDDPKKAPQICKGCTETAEPTLSLCVEARIVFER
jgi:hypothetical protein